MDEDCVLEVLVVVLPVRWLITVRLVLYFRGARLFVLG